MSNDISKGHVNAVLRPPSGKNLIFKGHVATVVRMKPANTIHKASVVAVLRPVTHAARRRAMIVG